MNGDKKDEWASWNQFVPCIACSCVLLLASEEERTRCDLTWRGEWVCPTQFSAPRFSVRVCSVWVIILWWEALSGPLTYQECGGNRGRLYACLRLLLLASGHALRRLDGEEDSIDASGPTILLRRDWILCTIATYDLPSRSQRGFG